MVEKNGGEGMRRCVLEVANRGVAGQDKVIARHDDMNGKTSKI